VIGRMASLGLSMGGRANGSGGPGLLLASSGAEKRRILVDRQDYEAGIQSDHQAWEEEINRRYPTRANYTAPKEVQGTYHDIQIDQLRNASQLGKPLYRSPPEDREKVFQLAAATTQPQIMPAGEVVTGSFADRAMPLAQALSAQKNKDLHQPRLKDLDLGADYKFGYRVYQCMIAWPGVAYRNTPVWDDRDDKFVGPLTGEVVIASAIVQGPRCVFIKCVSGNGWLPMSDLNGGQMCFKHLGPLNKIQFNRYDMCKSATPTQAALKAIMADATQTSSPGSLASLDLGNQFKFGMRVYQCTIVDVPGKKVPGVGYRNTPLWADKRKDVSGPKAPECIVADAIIQGPKSIFLRCTSTKGWLPLTDESGKRQFMLFKHLGQTDDVEINELQMHS